ncbi:hypothetical protein GCM10011613_24000 [Cellvibrio zantedeschiae]|uniref:DUF7832 domain-containing protein n=1 Tax=Cellvibrio zantedeschiae TaxID=1237077 RepID=A0ABQ3B4Z4_9GAMM|nr:hypothetical protein [Cellvibrio zantedeschiae]GGY78523.1 hypothetical protein GCM10011613_24000 [Cellvibrio zantedeschiae]
MKYDDASWHFESDSFGDLPEINGYTHTGTFLAWAIIKGLAGELHTEEWPEEIQKLKSREITPAEFFRNNCDGKFTDEDLNDLGNKFVQLFYENQYFGVYADAADPEDQFENIYEIPSSWETYEKVAPKLDHAFNLWKRQNL